MSPAQRPLLRLGAAFDAAFALPMLLAPGPSSRLLRIALPGDLTWFRLCAVLLLIAAGCYAFASMADDVTMRRVAVVSGCGRLLGCVVLVSSGAGAAVVATGVVDGVLGLLHLGVAAAGWRSARAGVA
jgi:hypothetical protein